jgi:hypothetical protein
MMTGNRPISLVDILRGLPPAGTRLSGGLALRLSHGNGMMVLGCSRARVTPFQAKILFDKVMVDA